MEKKLFWSLSDNEDLSSLYVRTLEEVKDYMVTGTPDLKPDDEDEFQFTVKAVFMTEEEFNNLPEYEF